ncbi:MAG: nucleotidyltransferase family protein [Chloroflexota bacterium]|nr:nucleotidyltransferase family protein [Chloroflexota bacterium]
MTEPPSGPIPVHPSVAAVILAAGASTRFGSPKQLARVGERTMLEAVVGIAREAGLHPILAVVPPRLAVPPDVVPVPNGEPEQGMSRSLKLGIAALPAEVDAAVVLLGDQPTLPVASVAAIVAARGARPIIAAASDGLAVPPVLVERRAFDIVQELEGDTGLREIIRHDALLVHTVSVEAVPADVDTPADLDLL